MMSLQLTKKGKFHSQQELTESSRAYRILPFRFERIENDKVIVTNDVGEYTTISQSELTSLVHEKPNLSDSALKDLRRIHVISEEDDSSAFALLPSSFKAKRR